MIACYLCRDTYYDDEIIVVAIQSKPMNICVYCAKLIEIALNEEE